MANDKSISELSNCIDDYNQNIEDSDLFVMSKRTTAEGDFITPNISYFQLAQQLSNTLFQRFENQISTDLELGTLAKVDRKDLGELAFKDKVDPSLISPKLDARNNSHITNLGNLAYTNYNDLTLKNMSHEDYVLSNHIRRSDNLTSSLSSIRIDQIDFPFKSLASCDSSDLNLGTLAHLNSIISSNISGEIPFSKIVEYKQTLDEEYKLSVATAEALGGIKLGTTSDFHGKNYPLKLNSDNKAYVQVPWSDTTISSIGATFNTANKHLRLSLQDTNGKTISTDINIGTSIPNNLTGTGDAGQLACFDDESTLVGLPYPENDKTTKFLRGDGTWASLNVATTYALGAVKAVQVPEQPTSAMPLKVDSTGQAFVVPVDTTSSILKSVLDLIYPVGSLYFTMAESCPFDNQQLYGQKWIQITENRALWFANGTNRKAGNSVNSGLPQHTHNYQFNFAQNNSTNGLPQHGGSSACAHHSNSFTTMLADYTANITQTTIVQPPAMFINVFKRVS